MIIAMVFVNLIFLPSIIAGIVVLFNQQSIDYSYGNLVIEPRENQLVITNVQELGQKINRVPGSLPPLPGIQVRQPLSIRENPRHLS